MNPTYIELPPGEAIECWGFTRSIAKAIHPTLESAEGIDCVIGKIVTHLNQRDDCKMPYPLTDEDRSSLEPLLADLPKLHGRMLDSENDAFLALYATLPHRLPWVPTLNSQVHTEKIKSEQWDYQAGHRETLQQLLSSASIQAFTSKHFLTDRIGPGTYIPREQAIWYLRSCGIQVGAMLSQKTSTDALAKVLNNEEIVDNNVQEDTIKILVESNGQQASNPPANIKWTDDKLEELLAHREKNTAEETAKFFGVSTRFVRKLLNKYREKQTRKSNWTTQLGSRQNADRS